MKRFTKLVLILLGLAIAGLLLVQKLSPSDALPFDYAGF